MSHSLAEFEFDGLRLLGFSLAGEESFVVLPEANLAFDLGRSPRPVLNVDHVFLSHGHMDHAAGVAYYFSQRNFIGNPSGTLYVPAGLEDPIDRLLRVWGEIDGQQPPAKIVVATPGADVELRRDLVVRPFQVNHPFRRRGAPTIHALGFVAIETRQKLKDEFQGLEGPQLVEIKKQGVEITRRVELPLVAYCGDTCPGDFVELDYVRQARVLVIECTFFDAEDLPRARAGNHMHVTDLRQVIPQLDNERILLTHLSRRTSVGEARAVLARELGPHFDDRRISFLMEHRARRRRGPVTGAEEE